MIRSIQPRMETKRSRDRLTAVKCAILHDRHNGRDPDDGRKWTWSYKKLAEEFELSSPRAAKDHVKLGRKILDGEESTRNIDDDKARGLYRVFSPIICRLRLFSMDGVAHTSRAVTRLNISLRCVRAFGCEGCALATLHEHRERCDG